MTAYLASLLVFAGINALLALGLNIVWGLGGMINLGLAGFFAVGAYASALLTVRLGWPMAPAALAAILIAALAGAVLAAITARLRGDYLALVTLGFAQVMQLVAANEIWLTGGTDGISGVPGPLRGALTPAAFDLLCVAICWALVGAALLALSRLAASPFGRVLRAIREDEMVAAVAGKHVLAFKLRAFAIGAGISGLAGSVYAHFNGYIAPDTLDVLLTLNVVLALTMGGTGRMAGAVAGALLLELLTEGTRFLGAIVPALAPVQVASLREAVIGLALIVVLRLRPQGLLPEQRRIFSLEASDGERTRPALRGA
ncbi:MAG TPA: branched-chain amino acid ABC transporter permease [Acetobacteraceae bacterium]|nr:branched-chain amino acid ABC transporter permease [Acetobacteraceae bacterium]